MKKLIEFKKQRELGVILSDSFGFIREEFKPLLKVIFQISGPYLLLFLISMAFYIYSTGDVFNFSVIRSNADFFNLPLLFVSLLLFIIFGMLAYTFANSAILHYIKSYIENDGNANVDEVKQNVKDTFWGFFGLSFLKWITIIITMMLCLFPVIYTMVPMYVVLCIYVFENKDATHAYSYSFDFIKSEYWITLATIFVIGIIVIVTSYLIDLPAIIYSLVSMGIFSGETDPVAMAEGMIDPVYIFLNVISYLFKFILNVVFTVSSAFIYFNINEKLNFTGTYERIQSLGKTE
jgi:hypothetical protein